jgi:hypothetical protein
MELVVVFFFGVGYSGGFFFLLLALEWWCRFSFLVLSVLDQLDVADDGGGFRFETMSFPTTTRGAGGPLAIALCGFA